jgi:transcriptional regulator with XRE-family HTH domain
MPPASPTHPELTSSAPGCKTTPPPISDWELGRRVCAIRHSRQMRQRDLAEAAGLTLATIGAVEAGRPCSVRTLLNIARALGVKAGDLLDANLPHLPPGRLESKVQAPPRAPAEKSA